MGPTFTWPLQAASRNVARSCRQPTDSSANLFAGSFEDQPDPLPLAPHVALHCEVLWVRHEGTRRDSTRGAQIDFKRRVGVRWLVRTANAIVAAMSNPLRAPYSLG